MSFDLKIINGDLVMKNGDLRKVEDSEKLIQDILKILLTEVGSNPNHPYYGSSISKSLIGSALDKNLLTQISESQIKNCLDVLKKLQEDQVKSFKFVTADEQIQQISSIKITKNISDPRYYDITIKAISKGRKPITSEFSISTI